MTDFTQDLSEGLGLSDAASLVWTRTATTTFDSVLLATRTVTTTFDSYLSRKVSTTLDSVITETRGMFRGTMTTADRDALTLPQPQDTAIVIDATAGTSPAQYWTGSAWVTGDRVHSPARGQSNNLVAPTTAGWRVENGDATYPIRYWDGTSRRFSVDASGGVFGTSISFGSAAGSLNQNDSVTVSATTTYATPTRVQGATNTGTAVATVSATWPGATTAGDMLWFFATSNKGSTLGQSVSTPPTGYTQAFVSLSSAQTAVGYYKLNCGAAEANPSITWSVSSNVTLTIEEYSGIATSSALDIYETAQSDASVTSAQTGDGPTTNPEELWVAGFACAATASNPTGGFTSLSSPAGSYAADLVVSAVGTAQLIVSLSPSSSYAGGIAAFKAATIAVPTPATNSVVLYGKIRSGISVLCYKDDAGVEHDLSYVTGNITRSFFLNARNDFRNDSATDVTVGTAPDSVLAQSLADAATQGIQTLFVVPSDYASGAITYVIYWLPGSTDASSHAVRWSTDLYEGSGDLQQSAGAYVTAWTGSSAARTVNEVVFESSQTLVTPGEGPGSPIRLNIRRLGSDAADTYVGAVQVVGVRISYTANY